MLDKFGELKNIILVNHLEEKWREKIPDPTEIDQPYLEWCFKLPGKQTMKPQKEPMTLYLRAEKYASLNIVLDQLKEQEGVNPLNLHLAEVTPTGGE